MKGVSLHAFQPAVRAVVVLRSNYSMNNGEQCELQK